MTDHELKTLYQILQMTEQGLMKTLPKILEHYYPTAAIHTTADYIYVVGDIPVALIAHLDIVHPAPPKYIYHDPEKKVIWSPDGLGADDRAGVFSILNILEDGYRPSVIFTTGEETGAKGAIQLVTDYLVPLKELYFLIELDRQGYREAVYYDCGNREFERFITNFGFDTDYGTFSDIAIIGPEWDIASVNLSIGYVDEHTRIERLYYEVMFDTIKQVENILESYGTTAYDHQLIVYPNEHGFSWTPWINSQGQPMDTCDCCEQPYVVSSLTWVDDDEGYRWRMCPKCFANNADACPECGTLIFNPNHEIENKKCHYCVAKEHYESTRASRKSN